MAAARINVPTVFVSGGPMLAGHVQGKKRSLSSMFEAVGSYAAGTMTEEEVRGIRGEGLSDLRLLFWNVHGELHELSHRGAGNGTSRKRHDPGSLFGAHQTRQACGYGGDGNVPQKISARVIL